MNSEFVNHIRNLLQLSKNIISSNPQLTKETGSVNVKGDKTIAMDVEIENAVINYAKKHKLPVTIFSEEIGIIKIHDKPTYMLVFDPLDGSTNYKIGKGLLPYGFMIACYKGIKPRLKDIITSGAVEHTTQSAWIFDGKATSTLDGKIVKINEDWEIHRSTPVYFDLYYKTAYDQFSPLAEKVHIRWSGSNIGSLLYVLSGVSACLGAQLNRPEEVGTIVSLMKGAGGITVNHHGDDLGNELFDSEKTYSLLAGSRKIVEYCLSQIKEKK